MNSRDGLRANPRPAFVDPVNLNCKPIPAILRIINENGLPARSDVELTKQVEDPEGRYRPGPSIGHSRAFVLKSSDRGTDHLTRS
jgi:hypothetical protein